MPFGPLEIILVLVVVLLVFGAKKLPEIGKGLGSGMREFRDGVSGRDDAGAGRTPSSEPASLQKAPQDDPAAASTAAATGSAPQAVAAEETVTAEPVADHERGASSSS